MLLTMVLCEVSWRRSEVAIQIAERLSFNWDQADN